MRIIIFARRQAEDGNSEFVFDITTDAEREKRTNELSRQGFEVFSGPPACDEKPPEPCPECGGAKRVVVGPPLGTADGPQYGNCPTCHGAGVAP